MTHDVFISYSHRNKPMADAVCATLEQNGIRCWYAPRDIDPGREWAECIIEAIASCRVFLLLFSDYSNASSQVLREVSKAVSAQKIILPMKVTDTVPSGGMEYYLNTVHWLDMLDSPLKERLHALLTRVDAVLGYERAEKPYVIPSTRRYWLRKRLPYLISGAALLAATCAIVILAGSGLLFRPSASTGTDPSTLVPFTIQSAEATLGNSLSNANNGGIAATDGEYVYYQSNDGMRLYRMRADGTGKTPLSDLAARDINVVGDTVYFSLITTGAGQVYRMDKSGGEPTLLLDQFVENLLYRNGALYFNHSGDGLKLYSLSADSRQLARVSTRKILGVLMDDNYLYYIDRDGAEYLCRSLYDGSGAEPISDFPARNASLYGSTLVYMQALPNGNSELVVQDTITLEKTILNAGIGLNGINVTQDGIYGWYGKNGRFALCRVNPDGTVTDLMELTGSVSNVCVAGDWVFFVNDQDNYTVWAVRTDGTGGGEV